MPRLRHRRPTAPSLLRALAIGGLIAVALPALAQAPSSPARVEVPIRDVVLSNGTHRYAIPITVGSVAMWAALDTGSTGLRILPGRLDPRDAAANGRRDSISFDSGVELDGVQATAQVGIGALSGPVPLQLVASIGCIATRPACPAAKIPAARYGLEGDGLAGEGFPAIIGASMGKAAIANPFVALGAREWIIELPRPRIAAEGRLILNPTEAEIAGFIRLRAPPHSRERSGGLHDSVSGCIAQDDARARACGPTILDTGAPGVRLVNSGLGPRPWPDGTAVTLAFYGGDGRPHAFERFKTGSPTRFANIQFETSDSGPAALYVGPLPYFAFLVLYEPQTGAVSLKPRTAPGAGPEP